MFAKTDRAAAGMNDGLVLWKVFDGKKAKSNQPAEKNERTNWNKPPPNSL